MSDVAGNVADTVTRTVTIKNDIPIAISDAYTIDEDTPAVFDVLVNDIDNYGILTISIETNTTHGTIENNGTSITYTPFQDFYGNDSFRYSIIDGNLTSNVVDVNITILSVNDAPIAYNGILEFNETNPPVGIPFELNATDVDINDTLTYIKKRVGDGSVTLDPLTGQGTYTPPPGFSGTTFFKFRVKDTNGSKSKIAKVSINIAKLNVAPIAKDMNVTVYVNENNKTIRLDGSDANGDDLQYTIFNLQNFSGGTLTQGIDNIIYYEHNLSEDNVTFEYSVNDGLLTSNTATVTIINVSNIAPVAYSQIVPAVDIDNQINIVLEGNDSDSGPSPALTYSLVEGPSFGTLTTTDANKTYIYTPDVGYTGNDSFTFKVNDGAADSNIALVSLQVNSPLSSMPYMFKWCKNNDTELWRTDGTTSNTSRLKDIYITGNSNPEEIIEINGTYYFTAVDAEGRELWKSQGTPESTVKIKDIASGSNSSNPLHLTNVNGTLYFSAEDGIHGRELWKSDGTTIGTQMVKDIKYSTGNSDPSELTNVNGILYFSANDGNLGEELWKSDGTTIGTQMVKDIYGGSTSSSPSQLTNIADKLYFAADDGILGNELWVHDNMGTRNQENYNTSDKKGSDPHDFHNHNGTLIYTAYGIFVGSEIGYVLSNQTNGYMDTSYASSKPHEYTTVGQDIYFSSKNTQEGFYVRKWRVGDNNIVEMTYDQDKSFAEDPENLTNINENLFFNTHNTGSIWLYKVNFTNGAYHAVAYKGYYNGTGLTKYTKIGTDLLFRITKTDGTEELKITDGTSVTDIVSGCGL